MITLTTIDEQSELYAECLQYFDKAKRERKSVIDFLQTSSDDRKYFDILISLGKYSTIVELIKNCHAWQSSVLKCATSECLRYLYNNLYFESDKVATILIQRLLDLGETNFDKYYNHPSIEIRSLICTALFSQKNYEDLEYFTLDNDEYIRTLSASLLNSLT